MQLKSTPQNLIALYTASGQVAPCDEAKEVASQLSLIDILEGHTSYLTQYDLLFRYVSLWLALQGHGLTTEKPHQTLKGINQAVMNHNITHVVNHRHKVKYQQQRVDPLLHKELVTLNTKWKQVIIKKTMSDTKY